MVRRACGSASSAFVLGVILGIVVLALGCGEDTESDVTGDTVPPDVVGTVPEDNGTWAVGSPIRVSFSEPVTSESVAAGLVLLGGDVSIRVEYDPTTLTATITPTTQLETGASYTLVVRRVQDLAGNTMTEVRQVSFTVTEA